MAKETTKTESVTTESKTETKQAEPKAESKPVGRKPVTRDKPEDAADAEEKTAAAKPAKASEDKQDKAPAGKESEGSKVKTMADKEAEDREKARGNKNPPKGSDENEDIARGEEAMKTAALRRKADALEEAGGDQAKVNELRHGAPAVRHTAVKTTAARDTDSAPTVRDAEAYAVVKQAEADEIAKDEDVDPEDLAAVHKAPRTKLSGVSGVTDHDTAK